ncbi:MAG: hypothetical protein JWO82_4405 [Akkermansiaceae bacterium]|nr:hypothetical protein [Akkermansiaceae bacterium]
MKVFQISTMAIALMAAGLLSCRQEEAKPKAPGAATVSKKQLDQAKEQIGSLQKELSDVDEDRRRALEQLRKNQELPEVVLRNRLDRATAESSAVLAWLKVSKRIAAGSADLDDAADYDHAKARAQDCLDQEAAIGKLFDTVSAAGTLSEADASTFLIQRDLLMHCRLEFEALLKDSP